MSQQEEYISKTILYLFWDIDITKADMDTCPAQIIQRVLEYGQWEDWQLIVPIMDWTKSYQYASHYAPLIQKP